MNLIKMIEYRKLLILGLEKITWILLKIKIEYQRYKVLTQKTWSSVLAVPQLINYFLNVFII